MKEIGYKGPKTGFSAQGSGRYGAFSLHDIVQLEPGIYQAILDQPSRDLHGVGCVFTAEELENAYLYEKRAEKSPLELIEEKERVPAEPPVWPEDLSRWQFGN